MALDFEIETAPFKKIPIFLDDIKNKAFPVANRNAPKPFINDFKGKHGEEHNEAL
jgi:hypothetical protein